MRKQLTALITALGEVATAVYARRQQRQDWRTEVWIQRVDTAREWA